MPDINEMRESRFLKKEDVGTGKLVTITAVVQDNVGPQAGPPEMKWVMQFAELDKPLVLNQVNAQTCAQILGNTNSDFWGGRTIVLYNDPTVSYGGKLTGGIRVRAPKPGSVSPLLAPNPAVQNPTPATTYVAPQQVPQTPPLPQDVVEEDDELPF